MWIVRCKKPVLDYDSSYNYSENMYEYEFNSLEQANRFAYNNNGSLVK
ncbi:MAG: hypothetical protein LBU60_02100 [Clostridiales bacterium]|nr:hypothetical protein [Clostridiales bacterium]